MMMYIKKFMNTVGHTVKFTKKSEQFTDLSHDHSNNTQMSATMSAFNPSVILTLLTNTVKWYNFCCRVVCRHY